MIWDYACTPTVWLSSTTVVLLLALSIHSWRRRNQPGALWFTICCLFGALWLTGSVIEYSVVDFATKVVLVKFQAAWQLPATTAATCFVLEYTWPGRWLNRRKIVLLFVPSLLAPALILTNDLHHLMWRGFGFDGSIILLRGPVNWAFLAYSYVLALLNIAIFAWLCKRSPQHRWPVGVMLTSQIGARLLYVMKATNVIQSNLPLDDWAVAIVFVTYGVVLFGFRILDPVPMARRMVIAQMHEGVLVLDRQGEVASLNPAAERILGVRAKRAVGSPIRNLLPSCTDTSGHLAAPVEAEIEFGAGPETRYYALNISSLNDWRGLEVGSLLLLQDVTDQKRAQAQKIEQQRALAVLREREQLSRELHDKLGQAFAFFSVQGQTIRRLLRRGEIPTADAYLERLVEVAREADVDTRDSILGLRVTLGKERFFPALEQYIAHFERNYGIHTELRKPATLSSGAFEPLVAVQLLRIVQEALTNVRKHAAASNVRIIFTVADDRVRVSIQDDGQGFDPAVHSDESGEHVGLRVMSERAEDVEGSVSLHSERGQGTEVVVWIPMRKEVERGGDCD